MSSCKHLFITELFILYVYSIVKISQWHPALFILKLLLLAVCSEDKKVHCVRCSNMLYKCLLIRHIWLQQASIVIYIIIWDDQYIAQSFKLDSATHQTLACSSTSSLTNCTVIDVTTDTTTFPLVPLALLSMSPQTPTTYPLISPCIVIDVTTNTNHLLICFPLHCYQCHLRHNQ